jgi:UDP-3-O-[3-hydroxymyristoyl] N-acetylglucosamine deacetylase
VTSARAAPIRLEGYALHAGIKTAVVLAPHHGPVTLGRGSSQARLEQLRVVSTDAAVRVAGEDGVEIELVEHFLAALGGLGIRDGVAAMVDGPEFPLLDGGARELADALAALRLPRATPALAVTRSSVLTIGASSYAFETGAAIEVGVEVDFAHPDIGRQGATWAGDATDFRERIARARTFGFSRDADNLRVRGRAQLCWSDEPEARLALARGLVAYDASLPWPGAAPPERDEAARHKLLDLIGDLTFYGGPPQGRIVALRPGHAATHHIVPQALRLGLLCRQ